jgi:hypothetical protein
MWTIYQHCARQSTSRIPTGRMPSRGDCRLFIIRVVRPEPARPSRSDALKLAVGLPAHGTGRHGESRRVADARLRTRSHAAIWTAPSGSCSRPPEGPRHPRLQSSLPAENYRSTAGPRVVKIDIVIYRPSQKGTPIFPTDYVLAVGSFTSRRPDPIGRSKNLSDLPLRHSIPHTVPARAGASVAQAPHEQSEAGANNRH